MSTASQAIIDLLRRIDAKPETPICLYDIGVPLVTGEGFSQDEILNALYWLQSEKVIELIEGNRLRLVKPLPSHGITLSENVVSEPCQFNHSG